MFILGPYQYVKYPPCASRTPRPCIHKSNIACFHLLNIQNVGNLMHTPHITTIHVKVCQCAKCQIGPYIGPYSPRLTIICAQLFDICILYCEHPHSSATSTNHQGQNIGICTSLNRLKPPSCPHFFLFKG